LDVCFSANRALSQRFRKATRHHLPDPVRAWVNRAPSPVDRDPDGIDLVVFFDSQLIFMANLT
jgi:hypothetical protein